MSTAEFATGISPELTIEPLDDRGSAVRFETQCVVIPDLPEQPPRRPKVVTKSYALPLWKKRSSSTSSSTSALPEDVYSEENSSHLVLRVPLPTFSRKHPSMVRAVDLMPLQPCLVHRTRPSGSFSSRTSLESPTRQPRIPRKPTSPSRADIVTVPLRPCCAACKSATEAAVLGGDSWQERFSRAAARRRSLSVDAGPRTITVAGSAASASYGALGVAISVDEIDKRRRSSYTEPPASRWEKAPGDVKAAEDRSTPLILRRTGTSSPSVDPPPITPATPRIPEEEDDDDESELFPLPSPKRTPTISPMPSPVGSMSSFLTAQSQSHRGSVSPTPSACSVASVGPESTKPDFLTPPTCSTSSLSLHKLYESMAGLIEYPSRTPSPSLLTSHPTLSGRRRSRPPSPRISLSPPTRAEVLSTAIGSMLPEATQSFEFVLLPASDTIPSSPDFSQSTTAPRRSSSLSRLKWRPKRSVSAEPMPSTTPFATLSRSPPTSPGSPTSPKRKISFSLSGPRQILTDVLHGVGSIGPASMVPGV